MSMRKACHLLKVLLGATLAAVGLRPAPPVLACECAWAFDDAANREASQEMPLPDLRARLAAARAEGASAQRRARVTFAAELQAGESFERPFGPGLVFRLEPGKAGWTITVKEQGRNEDLSRLTPPFHFVPNPRDIEGWHFRNADNTGPNEAGDKNVNAPGEIRGFIFSPEVGRTVAGPQARTAPSPEDIETVRRFGRGTLRILEYRLDNLEPGKQAGMEWMRFEVELSWPEATEGNKVRSSAPQMTVSNAS
ncbi:MAG: hypothetical protein AB1640_06710 [bacterium]